MSMTAKMMIGLVIAAVVAAASFFANRYAYLDFSNLKRGLKPAVPYTSQDYPSLGSETSDTEGGSAERGKLQNESRAAQYLTVATHDYYNGSYDEALRRLDRAKSYDSHNYVVYKLSGQIQFERNQYRKAFNEWARATQLPNYDQNLLRDLDVLKRLIRYCRTEIDRLQRTVNRDPADQVSVARLKELEQKIAE